MLYMRFVIVRACCKELLKLWVCLCLCFAGVAQWAGAADSNLSLAFSDSSSPLQVRAVRDWSNPLADSVLAQDGYTWTIFDAQGRQKWQFGTQIKTNIEHLVGPFNIERVATNSSDFSDVNGDGKRDILFACATLTNNAFVYSMRLYDAVGKNLLWQRPFTNQNILAAVSGKTDNKKSKSLNVVVRTGSGYDSTTQTYASRGITVLDGLNGKVMWSYDLGAGGLFAIALDDWDHSGLMDIRVQDQNKTMLFDGQTFARLWSIPLNVPAGWSFATMVNRTPTGPADYSISDVDGDGNPDLMVTARPTNNAPVTMIQVYSVPSGTLKWSQTVNGSVNVKVKSMDTNAAQGVVVNSYLGNPDTSISNNTLSVLNGADGSTNWSVNLGSSFPGTLILNPNKDGRYQILAPLSNSLCFFNAGDGSVARQLPLTVPDSSVQTWQLISFGPSFQYAWGGESQLADMNADSSTDVAVVWKGSSGAYWFQVYDAVAGTMTSQMETANDQDATQFSNNRFWLNPDPVCKLVYVTQSYNSGSQYYYNRALNIFDPSLPPQIVAAPQDQTGRAGSNFVLSVGVSGSRPLVYQWLFNGSKLAGATNSTLTLRNAQSASTGNYSVTVTNRAGTQIATAAVTIIETNPPVVTVVTLVPGQSVAASFLAVTGKATDESGVAQVLWNLNHELKPASCLPAKTIAPALARLRNHLFYATDPAGKVNQKVLPCPSSLSTPI